MPAIRSLSTDPATGFGASHDLRAVLGASSYTFVWASLTKTLLTGSRHRSARLKFFPRACPKAMSADNLKSGQWPSRYGFEPSINSKTFAEVCDAL